MNEAASYTQWRILYLQSRVLLPTRVKSNSRIESTCSSHSSWHYCADAIMGALSRKLEQGNPFYWYNLLVTLYAKGSVNHLSWGSWMKLHIEPSPQIALINQLNTGAKLKQHNRLMAISSSFRRTHWIIPMELFSGSERFKCDHDPLLESILLAITINKVHPNKAALIIGGIWCYKG